MVSNMNTNLLSILFFIFSLCFDLFNNSCSAEVSISLNTTIIHKSGDHISINWTGIDSPSNLDWLGLYSPANSSNENFIGYIFLSKSPGYESGSGSITIPLVNLRSDYQFRIFHWNESEVDMAKLDNDKNPLPGTEHLLAVSEDVGFESGRGPEHVHLSLTGRMKEMRVMFVTHNGEEHFVRYGLKKDNLYRVVGSRVSRYEKEDLCSAPANDSIGWRDPGYIHDGVMVDLKKGKRYYYQVGSDVWGWSETFSFVSPDDETKHTIAFMFGDMGTATPYTTFDRTQVESANTVKWISRDIDALGDKPALISHIGDISYARGYSWLWDNFFTQIEPIASRVPYHVAIGNHEYDWPQQPWRPDWAVGLYKTDGGGECGVPYSLRFNMPGELSEPTGTRAPATRNVYYSFDMGVVHFVYFSTETNFLPESQQYQFLKNDLESVDREKTPFVVASGHRPMYTTSTGHKDGPLQERMKEHLEPLFVKNKVSLVLWGHVHRYERFCPMNNFTCGSLDKNGDDDWQAFPVHIVIGMAGQDYQPTWKPRDDHPNDPVFPQPAQSMYRGGEFGYTKLVATKKKLKLYYIGNHDGRVHDEVEIRAPGHRLSHTGGSILESSFSWLFRNINAGAM